MCCHRRRIAEHRDGRGDEVTIPKEHFVVSLFRGSVFRLKPLPIIEILLAGLQWDL